jgi:hypothetical protein
VQAAITTAKASTLMKILKDFIFLSVWLKLIGFSIKKNLA